MNLLTLLAALVPVVAAASPLDGVWVPSTLKQALESGQPGEMPCWIRIEGGEPPSIVEDCQGERASWSDVAQAMQRTGTLEVEGRIAEGGRRLVLRAGAPNELERVVLGPEGGVREVQRLYRLPEGTEERLANWSAAQRLLVHPFRTADGAKVEFRSDGTYRFAEETGRYEMESWPLVEGAVGLLTLTSTEGRQRLHWVVSSGERVGLSPAQESWQLEKLRTLRDQALATARRQEEARVAAGAGEASPGGAGAFTGIGVGFDGTAPAGGDLPQGSAVDTTEQRLDAMVERLRGSPAMDRQQPGEGPVGQVALGAEGADPVPASAEGIPAADSGGAAPIFRVDPEDVTVWLVQDDRPAAMPPPGEVAALDEEGPVEIPAIAQPIAPQRKGCGCNSGGAMGGLALLPLLGLVWYRPRRGHPKG